MNNYLDYKQKYLEMKKLNYLQIGGKKNKKNKIKRMDNKITYVENVSEPWFTLISLGLKTVEGRKNKGVFKDMKIGDIIKWTNDNFFSRSVQTEIIGKNEYPTFQEYLESEGIEKCLPGINDIDNGLSVYYKYYTKEDEQKYGVVAIQLKKL